MALLTCPDCQGKVSDSAPTCPHCGRPMKIAPVAAPPVQPAAQSKPAKPKKNNGCATLIFIVVAVFVLTVMFGNHDAAPSRPKSAEAAQPEKPDAAAEAKAAACREDVVCTAEEHAGYAEVMCKPQIEARALHDVKWSDGFMNPMMTRYKWANPEKTAITYIGDKASLQNGFGAYTPTIYLCTLDLATNKVINLEMAEGRLPAD
jgi:hypothetical protein